MVCEQEILNIKYFLKIYQNETETGKASDKSLFSKRTQESSNKAVYFFVLLSIVMLLILLTNSLMTIGIWKTNKKLTMAHKLLIYTSVTDLIVGLFILPYFIASRSLGKFSCFTDMITVLVGTIVSSESQQTILTLSIMRYVSLNSPLKTIRNSTVIKVVITQMFISIGMSALKFNSYQILNNYNILETITTNLVGYILEWVIFGIITIACILSAVIFNILSRKTLLSKEDIQHNHQYLEKHRKAVKRLLLISLCNIVCYFPTTFYQLYAVIVIIIDSNINLLDIAVMTENLDLLGITLLAIPALNSLVFIMWNKRILKYYKRVLNNQKQRLVKGRL